MAFIQSTEASRAMQNLPQKVLVECWDYRVNGDAAIDRTPKHWTCAFSLETTDDDKLYLKTTVGAKGRCDIKSLNLRETDTYYNITPTSKKASWSVCIRRPSGAAGNVAGECVYYIRTNEGIRSIWANLSKDGTGSWGYGDFNAIRASDQELSENGRPCAWMATQSGEDTRVLLNSEDGCLQATITNSSSSSV